MEHGGALFYLKFSEQYKFGVTSTMTTMLAVTVLLTLLSYFATRKLQERPKGLQNLMEAALDALRGFLAGVLGSDSIARRYLPLLATFFLFILFSNYSGLLPMAGHLPGLAPPTATLSVTAGLAIVSFFAVQFYGFKTHKLGYFRHFLSPIMPLLILEEFIHPLSLSLRLYGNIFGEETVSSSIFGIVPLLAPLPMYVLGILFGAVQALVFTVLTSIYISTATGKGH
ncbi:MAG: F0F1 ATP synthase subunit A [Clostridiales bacterium]|jgi:F-type H+-transporting ATPase subunit a|nr:F0F1 ATP synthase subunit A [Clostridiales bacterium]MDR2713485.1 F0F1 ATP synthase subunit A [Clostridiales bacterium]